MTFGIVKIKLNGISVDGGTAVTLNNLTTTVNKFDLYTEKFKEDFMSSTQPMAPKDNTEDKQKGIIIICSPDKDKYILPTTVWMWFDLAWYNLVPFLVILLCNIGIIITVTRASTARKRMANQGKTKVMYNVSSTKYKNKLECLGREVNHPLNHRSLHNLKLGSKWESEHQRATLMDPPMK